MRCAVLGLIKPTPPLAPVSGIPGVIIVPLRPRIHFTVKAVSCWKPVVLADIRRTSGSSPAAAIAGDPPFPTLLHRFLPRRPADLAPLAIGPNSPFPLRLLVRPWLRG